MPKPLKRRELIRRLRLFGWEGEYQDGKHPFLVKAGIRLTIPNPHSGDLDLDAREKNPQASCDRSERVGIAALTFWMCSTSVPNESIAPT
jgi:predicted RNA binding protein YcfA (HicA-like mRNA interferase family)